MTTDNQQAELANEIYLTAKEFDHWFSPAHFWADELTVAGVPLILQNQSKLYDSPNSRSSETMSAMILMAFGNSEREPEPEPEPVVRKLTRAVDAAWTLFRCVHRVIAVNDDGSVAVKIIPVSLADDYVDCAAVAQSPLAKKYKLPTLDDKKWWISPKGSLSIGGDEQTQEDLAEPGVDYCIEKLHAKLKDWKKREHGRKVPLGIPRLLKRIKDARKIYPPRALMTVAEVDARCAIFADLKED